MKKTILILALGLGAIVANAQADVPAAVKNEFKALYPNVKVTDIKWDKDDGNYEADFTNDNTPTSVTFDGTGKLLETETAITASDLPKAVQDYVAKNLPGKKIKTASKIKDSTGKMTYEVEINEVDYTFDANGNFLKQEEDND